MELSNELIKKPIKMSINPELIKYLVQKVMIPLISVAF